MKTRKLFAMIGIGVAAFLLTACGDDQQAKKQEDQSKTMQYWLDLSKETELEVNTDTIYPGVTVMGVDLGGLTVAEATDLIKQEINEQILDHTVILKYKEEEWTFSFEELGVSADAGTIAKRAYEIGRSGDLRQRQQIINTLADDAADVQIDTAFDEEKLAAVVEGLADELDSEPVDAILEFKKGKFSITPEVNGTALDLEKTVADIQNALTVGDDGVEIELSVKEVKPDLTEESLSAIQDVIGSGSTYYSTSNYGREQNLIVGSSKLNGMIVMPDEVVSFNTMVAPITVENGYHEANVIVGDEYVPGLGGGLCQVSTTLYNAVIRAELEVLERDCHAFPADYVPMGMDAAVAQGYIDFQFKNNTGYPIYISMWCGGGEIGAEIYGKEIHDESRKLSFDYVITSVIEKPKAEETEDPSLKPGERVVEVEGHTGYTVDTYKTVTENGESYTEWFSTSYYMASADKVKVGPKKTETSTPEASTPTASTTPVAPESVENSTVTTPETSTTVEESVPVEESAAGAESTPNSENSTPTEESSVSTQAAE